MISVLLLLLPAVGTFTVVVAIFIVPCPVAAAAAASVMMRLHPRLHSLSYNVNMTECLYLNWEDTRITAINTYFIHRDCVCVCVLFSRVYIFTKVACGRSDAECRMLWHQFGRVNGKMVIWWGYYCTELHGVFGAVVGAVSPAVARDSINSWNGTNGDNWDGNLNGYPPRVSCRAWFSLCVCAGHREWKLALAFPTIFLCVSLMLFASDLVTPQVQSRVRRRQIMFMNVCGRVCCCRRRRSHCRCSTTTSPYWVAFALFERQNGGGNKVVRGDGDAGGVDIAEGTEGPRLRPHFMWNIARAKLYYLYNVCVCMRCPMPYIISHPSTLSFSPPPHNFVLFAHQPKCNAGGVEREREIFFLQYIGVI